MRLFFPALLPLAACYQQREPAPVTTTDTAPPDTEQEPEEIVLLDNIAWLARASLELRGVRPSLEELQQVQDDPTTAEALITAMLDDERFPHQMAWLWNDSIHTAVWGESYDRFGEWSFAEWKAVGWEPLAVIELVLTEGRPFSDVVTAADYPIQEDQAALWGLEGGDAAWSWGSYGDDRPMAGILSTNTLWLRYTADAVNVNRTRANTIADVFLCSDFLSREGGFDFDINPADLAEVESAVRTQPACLTCHSALDPLANFFGGFAQKSDSLPIDQYVHYSRVDHLRYIASHSAPIYYGHPSTDIADLGTQIAADSRFYRCVTRRIYTGLVRQPPEAEILDPLSRAFFDNGAFVRSLVADIVTSDAYRADTPRTLHSEVLTSVLTELLALEPSEELDAGLNAMTWDPELRLLSGGTDDITVLQRNERPGIGLAVAMTWAARKVAADAIAADRQRATPLLMTVVDTDEQDESLVREQLALWHTRFLSEPVEADSPEVDALYNLLVALQESGEDPWPGVLAALIRHPGMVLY